jgi:hypothetical protein
VGTTAGKNDPVYPDIYRFFTSAYRIMHITNQKDRLRRVLAGALNKKAGAGL